MMVATGTDVDLSPVHYRGGKVYLIDQRLLPAQEVWLEFDDVADLARAISDMVVRGAPAIGITAAYGLVLAARSAVERGDDVFGCIERAAQLLSQTRPTAVNLFWAIRRMLAVAKSASPDEVVESLEREALRIHREDVAMNVAIGVYGARLLPRKARVLTHCNAGALATGGFGTALGIIRAAILTGKQLKVYVNETRPFLQGARLTMWELTRDGIDCVLVTDGMGAHLMARGLVDAVVVGADRIARNGDVANKIGTYGLAIWAREHGVPFYVAAPTSTLDPELPSGEHIPIEERSPAEVVRIRGVPIAPEGAQVMHPAFDVTPHRYITAIITDCGVLHPPYHQSISEALNAGRAVDD